MSYATTDDMLKRFGIEELQMIVPGRTQGGIDKNKVDDAIVDAQSEIDSYLAQRYQVPLEAPPISITSACCDIARYRLYTHQATDEVNHRYKDRIAWLKSLSKGEAALEVADTPSASIGGAKITTTGGCGRLFTLETLRDF